MCSLRTHRKTIVGGHYCTSSVAVLVLVLYRVLPPSVAVCPSCCLCTSDIISCGGCNLSMLQLDLPSYATRLDLSHNLLTALPTHWNPQPFDRLSTLVFNKNLIGRIEVNAFNITPRLLHLDLSSNCITALNVSLFSELKELKELLLFDNHIVKVSSGAFSGLHNLQRLYLSLNRLKAFPLEIYWEPEGPRNLSFLDVSYNRLSEVPVQSLLILTHHRRIYFQKNPLVCDCALLALLQYWMWKQYRPLVDFRHDYTCGNDTIPGPVCSVQSMLDLPLVLQTYRVEHGKWLRVPCPGLDSPTKEGPVVFWVTPNTVVNSSTIDSSARVVVLPNGTLEIRGALTEDYGAYGCVAARHRHYYPFESVEVNVVVGNLSTAFARGLTHRGGMEYFNTAFTTLVSCVISILLVLLYLYLTPCRCRELCGGSCRCGAQTVILCSDPGEVETGQPRSNGKRVAFSEPQVEDSDICGPKTPALNLAHVATEGILKNGNRTMGPIDPAHTEY